MHMQVLFLKCTEGKRLMCFVLLPKGDLSCHLLVLVAPLATLPSLAWLKFGFHTCAITRSSRISTVRTAGSQSSVDPHAEWQSSCFTPCSASLNVSTYHAERFCPTLSPALYNMQAAACELNNHASKEAAADFDSLADGAGGNEGVDDEVLLIGGLNKFIPGRWHQGERDRRTSVVAYSVD